MKWMLGEREVEENLLTDLKDCNNLLHDAGALRQRMAEDGYLLIRNFHDREAVLQARLELLNKVAEKGGLDPNYQVEQGILKPGDESRSFMWGGTNKDKPALLNVINSPRLMGFFDEFLGGPSVTYDYKWPRAMGTGKGSNFHYDVVYMGRGTRKVYTVWTPLGDVPLEKGPLAVLLGSHNFKELKETYGQIDVDKDITHKGYYSNDPLEIVDKFGGQWASTNFKAGDIIIFGMFLMHGSLRNQTNSYRTSVDSRYQLASEPIDERWVGDTPKAHYAWSAHKK